MDFKNINKSSPIPVYYQLKKIISEKVESGELKIEEKITSEEKLAKLYQISRMTVRQAIKELVVEGLLYREKGKGTFVARTKLKRNLAELTSLSKEMKQSGYRVRTKVLEMKVISSSYEVANRLEIAPGNKVIKISRLVFANDKAFFLETSFLPFEICPGLIEDDLEDNSLYSLLECKYKLILFNAIASLEAVSANSYQSNMLDIKKGSPLILLKQVVYSMNNSPIQYAEALSKCELYKYYVSRKRRE